jgi:hypothetical protein
MKEISRREALHKTAMAIGTAVSTPTLIAFLKGCTPKPELNWKPKFFTEEQARFISEISEIILPKTDTPGAKELGVPQFIEDIIALCSESEVQERFVLGLEDFRNDVVEKHGKPFFSIDLKQQQEIVGKINTSLQYNNAGLDDILFFYRKIKEITILGYFTTEVGATQVLQYKAIPTEYKGCISVEEAGGKSWATS